MKLNECATVLRNLCAPLAAHSCETVQVYCKEQNFEYQMHEISRERSHLIGYQCALKDLDTYGNRDYARTVEAIDEALIAMAAYRDSLRDAMRSA